MREEKNNRIEVNVMDSCNFRVVCVHKCMCVCIYYMCVCICMCVYVCVCVYLHVDGHDDCLAW